MLKWAINEPRPSYLPYAPGQKRAASLNELNHVPSCSLYATSTTSSRFSCWQSVDDNCPHLKKENQITSTPLLSNSTSDPNHLNELERDLQKLESLKDLSSILVYPEHCNVTPKKPIKSPTNKKTVNCNASTLPTLDANEYSPSSALIPGPLLALRGIGIPDVYFKKPRYFETTPQPALNEPPAQTSHCTKLSHSPAKSLSSSQMDDSTLERMIEAIIASSHKDDNKMSSRLTRQYQAMIRPRLMSPTYTPAYDPASDLDEICFCTEQNLFKHGEQLMCTPKTHKPHFPDSFFKTKRLQPTRHKRKLKSFRNTFKKSARKLVKAGNNITNTVAMPLIEEGNTESSCVNLSPTDSEHNSSGGDSIKTEELEGHHHHRRPIDAPKKSIHTEVEVTKRRLSFHCN